MKQKLLLFRSSALLVSLCGRTSWGWTTSTTTTARTWRQQQPSLSAASLVLRAEASSSSSNSAVEDTTTTTTTTTTTPSSASSTSLLWGGDYCGLRVTCDSITGSVQDVPSVLVPESMLEWGQVPNVLEVITSEDDKTETSDTTTRYGLVILPETGCAIDNLYCQTEAPKQWTVQSLTDSVIAAWSTTENKVEATFAVDSDDDDDDNAQLRLRVALEYDRADTTTQIKTVTMHWERQFDTQSSQGKRAQGGGLDGASVSRWMSPSLRKSVQTILQQHTASNKEQENQDDTVATTTLDLPGGVTVSTEEGTTTTTTCLAISYNDQTVTFTTDGDDVQERSIQVHVS